MNAVEIGILKTVNLATRMRPACESNMWLISGRREIKKALDNLEAERKIVICRQHKDGVYDRVVYLIGDSRITPSILFDIIGTKIAQLQQVRKCTNCGQDRLLAAFADESHNCMKCDHIGDSNAKVRNCLICKVPHPASYFDGRKRMCIATTGLHDKYKRDHISTLNKAHRDRCKENRRVA